MNNQNLQYFESRSIPRSVRPSVSKSVTPSLRHLLGASYADYSALFNELKLAIESSKHFCIHLPPDFVRICSASCSAVMMEGKDANFEVRE